MRIFLETSLLCDADLPEVSERVLDRYIKGDQFFISSISHFQLEWGYYIAHRSSEKYSQFLRDLSIEIIPLTKLDAEDSASMRPNEKDILDALIAASVKRLGALLWTEDRDFLKFLPKSKVELFHALN